MWNTASKPDTGPIGREERQIERKSLLQRTSDSVKAVQAQFAVKNERATSNDPRVSTLCAQLEAVFNHGLKAPKKKGAELTYWPLVRAFLAPVEVEYYSSLTNINTDSGRARAWLRASLNDRSLAKTLRSIADHPSQTAVYYDDYAFLLDEDLTGVLAMLVIGLESTIFAIEVDNADLNTIKRVVEARAASPVSIKSGYDFAPVIYAAPDPVQDTNGSELKKKKKKKKRVVNANIGQSNEFEDDDNTIAANNKSLPPSPPNVPVLPRESPYVSQSSSPSTTIVRTDAESLSQRGPLSPESYARATLDAVITGKPLNATTTISVPPPSLSKPQSVAATPPSVITAVPTANLLASPAPLHTPLPALSPARVEATQTDPRVALGAPSTENEALRTRMAMSTITRPISLATMTTEDQYVDSMSKDELKTALLATMRKCDANELRIDSLSQELTDRRNEIAFLQRDRLLARQEYEALQEMHEQAMADAKKETLAWEAERNSLARLAKLANESELDTPRASNRSVKVPLASSTPLAAMGTAASDELISKGSVSNDSDGDNLQDKTLIALGPTELPEGYNEVSELAAYFERQLKSLTEMYSDLMEYNERLIQQIKEKDLQIRSLTFSSSGSSSSYEGARPQALPTAAARISHSPANVIVVPGSQTLIKVWIPTAFLSGEGSSSHHMYQIRVRVNTEEWSVCRRYSHFTDLHKQVLQLFPKCRLTLPPKKTIRHKSPKFVEERRVSLEIYIKAVVSLLLTKDSPLRRSATKEILCRVLPFLKEGEFLSLEEGGNALDRTYQGT